MKILACDSPVCDNKQPTREYDEPPIGWLTISRKDVYIIGDDDYHLCSWSCVNDLAVRKMTK